MFQQFSRLETQYLMLGTITLTRIAVPRPISHPMDQVFSTIQLGGSLMAEQSLTSFVSFNLGQLFQVTLSPCINVIISVLLNCIKFDSHLRWTCMQKWYWSFTMFAIKEDIVIFFFLSLHAFDGIIFLAWENLTHLIIFPYPKHLVSLEIGNYKYRS